MSNRNAFRALHAALLLTLAACSGARRAAGSRQPIVAAGRRPRRHRRRHLLRQHGVDHQPDRAVEVASSESFCDFYQFSWQWFLAQVSPSEGAYPSGDRVFETNRVVDPQGGSNQCAGNALTGRAVAAKMLSLRGPKPVDFEDHQADGNALYDQSGNILYYNMWYSPEECQASRTTGFVAATLEIKTSWRVLPGADPTYFTMQATLPSGGDPVTLGLVGFHLVNWTSKHPEFIWSSFEHKSNAPLCDGSDATSGWSLTSDLAAACLAANPSPSGSISPNRASFDFKAHRPNTDARADNRPRREICRLSATAPARDIDQR